MKQTKYKYDMHCHIFEGSGDSKVKGITQIKEMSEKGFSGFLVTDHDSYKGYDYLIHKYSNNNERINILKGIEYSTLDAGHIIVIMPCDNNSSVLETKKMNLSELIDYVHSNNGILGPAHACSEPYLSIFNCKKYKNNYDILKCFDFIEVLNAGEKKEENDKTLLLAKKYGLFIIAGSDSHYPEHCGSVYTEFNKLITNNDELIDYIKSNKEVSIGGFTYRNFDREKYDRFGKVVYYYSHLLVKYKNKIIK